MHVYSANFVVAILEAMIFWRITMLAVTVRVYL